jgi:hypothetical protein
VEEVSLDGKHLVVTCTIYVNDDPVRTYALTDRGATGFAFVDESFARHYQIPFEKLLSPWALRKPTYVCYEARPLSYCLGNSLATSPRRGH